MATYSQFGTYTPPVLYGDDEESKRTAQTQPAPTAPAPMSIPLQPTSPFPPGGPVPQGYQPPSIPLPGNPMPPGYQPPPPPQFPAGGPRPQAPQPAHPPVQPPRPTFAQLQAQGQARPAPITLQSPTTQAAPTGDMEMWRQQVTQAAATPTRFDNLAFMQMRNTAQDDLNAQFGNQRVSLDEELARRGLFDSTVAANQYRDLGGQQARAMANLDSQLLREMAQTQMQDRLASAGLAGQLASFGENSRQFDRQQSLAEQLGLGNLNLNRDQLFQQNEQFGRSQSLAEQLGLGGLDLNRDQLAQQNDQFGRSLQQNDLARQLQERLAMTEMSGVYQGANGQNFNTLGRDRLAVEREVGGNDLLIRLASMLGMDGLTGLIGNGGTNTAPTQTGTTTQPVGTVPTTTAPNPNEWSARRPGESQMEWLARLRRAGGPPRTTTGTTSTTTTAQQPGTDEVTQGGGQVDQGTLAQLMALLGGG